MATTSAPKVYEAIAAVMADLSVDGIAKARNNTQQGYNFRGIDDVYNALSPVLAKHKLCMLPRILSREVVERKNKSGGALFNVTVEAEFDLICAEDGSKHTVKTFGEAMDSADKATNKAMSAAYKYAAMQAFAIPTEGDNDADATTHEIAPDEHPQATKANSREVYDRLSKANRSLANMDAFNAFWAKESVQAAAKSLPSDWAKSLKAEKEDKYAELADQGRAAPDDPFPGDMAFDQKEAAE
jgi:hypothetical protein